MFNNLLCDQDFELEEKLNAYLERKSQEYQAYFEKF